MYRSLKQISRPTADVVSLLEAKLHLRVDGDDEDDLIQGLIDAAVSYLDGADGVLGRALAPQDWEVVFCGDTAGELPLVPVISQQPPVTLAGETTVRFRAGYEDGVPASIRAAILMHIGSMYQDREREAEDWKPTKAYEALLAPHRRWIG